MPKRKKRSYDYKFQENSKKHKNSGLFDNEPDYDIVKLKPFVKNIYLTPSNVQRKICPDVAAYRTEKHIKVFGHDVPDPIQNFSDYQFPPYLTEFIEREQYKEPTPIQSQGWSIVLSGMDMVGIAETGSGKTLAYIFPALAHISHQENLYKKDGPIALILAPTRELAQQIVKVCRELGDSSGIRSTCVFGGARKEPQIRDLKAGSQICVATPGRLIEFLESGNVTLKCCTYLVVDEADRMLDMGFGPQISAIISRMRPDRQSLMWSATWPKDVRKLARKFLKDYIRVNIGSLDLSANHNISQVVDVCSESEKGDKLQKLLEKITSDEGAKVIIFAETKLRVADIARSMKFKGFPSVFIHGDNTQAERNFALHEFRSYRANILVATDVAARGLDIDDVKFVINYDYPSCSEDYVHRIGRTGRCNKSGTAYTFITKRDGKKVKDLIGILKEAGQSISSKLYDIMKAGKLEKDL